MRLYKMVQRKEIERSKYEFDIRFLWLIPMKMQIEWTIIIPHVPFFNGVGKDGSGKRIMDVFFKGIKVFSKTDDTTIYCRIDRRVG